MEALQVELRELRERERLFRGRSEPGAEEVQAVENENQALRAELAQTKGRVEELAGMVKDVLARLPVWIFRSSSQSGSD